MVPISREFSWVHVYIAHAGYHKIELTRKLKGRHFSLHVRFSSGDFNVAHCVLSSRGMYSLYNTWYWVVMSVLVFVFTDFVCIMKTSPCNVYPLTPHFYIVKLGFTGVYIIFLFLL